MNKIKFPKANPAYIDNCIEIKLPMIRCDFCQKLIPNTPKNWKFSKKWNPFTPKP